MPISPWLSNNPLAEGTGSASTHPGAEQTINNAQIKISDGLFFRFTLASPTFGGNDSVRKVGRTAGIVNASAVSPFTKCPVDNRLLLALTTNAG